jgi:predicted RNase H-like nuclease (RuvC/YqgF family)
MSGKGSIFVKPAKRQVVAQIAATTSNIAPPREPKLDNLFNAFGGNKTTKVESVEKFDTYDDLCEDEDLRAVVRKLLKKINNLESELEELRTTIETNYCTHRYLESSLQTMEEKICTKLG